MVVNPAVVRDMHLILLSIPNKGYQRFKRRRSKRSSDDGGPSVYSHTDSARPHATLSISAAGFRGMEGEAHMPPVPLPKSRVDPLRGDLRIVNKSPIKKKSEKVEKMD